MSKIDLVLTHIIELKEDVSAIKQHLKDINGSVARHEKKIGANEKELSKVNILQAKYVGGIAVLSSVVTVVITFVINKFI